MVSTYIPLEGNEVLRVTVELVRHSDGKVIPIATLVAANIGGDDMHGDYNLNLYEYSNTHTPSGPVTPRVARLEHFQRSRGALSLLRVALQQAFGK